MNKAIPILSIICPTYNQEKFIGQALDGFVMQKTEYPFEIIVHDDASTDKTAAIAKAYEDKFPHLFSNIYQSENQLSKSIDNVTKITFNAAQGKYLALCEGDDYWTDPYKLEKQIRFLENHPTYVGCFHNTEERFENDDNKASFLYCDDSNAKDYSFGELSLNNPIPTCSVVFRNKLFADFPKWYRTLKMGDWPLHLLNAQFGNYWYMPKVMGVHRLHSEGIWMSQHTEKMKQYTIEAYDIMIDGFANNQNLQQKLIVAKKNYMTSPLKPGLARRTINFIRKFQK
jgi:glycosyltransferase involved in cell wall biosynthesis